MLNKLERRSDPSTSRTKFRRALKEEAKFISSWLRNPASMGAILPSGVSLARQMAQYVDLKTSGAIIELGAGTGAITEALIERGVKPQRLLLIEHDPNFCKVLQGRFPGSHVLRGDAYDLKTTLGDRFSQPASAIISSLPLLNRPEIQRLALLSYAFDYLAPGGIFVQFTYGWDSPIPRRIGKTPVLGIEADKSPLIWRNFPPARVWVYRPTDVPLCWSTQNR